MSDIFLIQGSTLTNAANAIRDHIGGGEITPGEFPEKIDEVYDTGYSEGFSGVPSGSCTVEGGELTPGDGLVSATGTKVALTELSSAPTSGSYITVTGSGKVTRAAVTKAQTAGYIPEQAADNVIESDEATSNLATKYYAIVQEDTVYLYGVYEFIETPTKGSCSYSLPFGRTSYTGGNPGTTLDITHSALDIQASGSGFKIFYDSSTVYDSAGGPGIKTGWQTSEGESSDYLRTIIIPNPVPIDTTIATTNSFYTWFLDNTERIGDWGERVQDAIEDEKNLGTITVVDGETRTITPSDGYIAMRSAKFTVDIPNDYIPDGCMKIPTDTLHITTNNTYDVVNYAKVVVNIDRTLSGTWEIDGRKINSTGTAVYSADMNYSIRFGDGDGIHSGTNLTFNNSGMIDSKFEPAGERTLYSLYEREWKYDYSINDYPTAELQIEGSYKVSEEFYQQFIKVATCISDGGSGGGSLSTCTLNTGSYPTSGHLFYTDADGATQYMSINSGTGQITITCGKIYVIGPESKLGLMSDTQSGTKLDILDSNYCIEIDVPASKYAGKQVDFKYAFS